MKTGLDYFPLDCYMDDSVKLIEAELGLEGFAIVIKLWQEIYGGEGYYKPFDADVQLLFARSVGVKASYIRDFLIKALTRGIFNKDMYDKYKILTSKGIQQRFLNCAKRRKANLIKDEFNLLDSEEKSVCKNEKNVCKNEKNADIFAQSKVKQSKVKQSRAEERDKKDTPAPEKIQPASASLKNSKPDDSAENTDRRKMPKRLYGEYKHVVLADDEFNSLLAMLGKDDLYSYIKKVDEYIEESGKKYKNTYLTIKRWYEEDKKKAAPEKVVKKTAFSNYVDTGKADYKNIKKELLEKMLNE